MTTRTTPRERQPTTQSTVDVCFVQRASPSFGGGSQMLWRLLDGLDEDRFDVTLLSQFEDEVCRRAADTDHVSVEIVPYRGSLDAYDKRVLSQPPHRLVESGVRVLQFDLEARDALLSADVVWCDCLRSVLTIAPVATVSSAPVVWNIGLGYESTGLRRYLNEAALRVADRVFIESRQQAREVFTEGQYAAHRDAFVSFHKGIDTDEYAPSGDRSRGDTLRVGTAALLTPRKGIEHFVDAAATIAARRDDVSFAVAGDTVRESDRSYRRALEQRVEDAGLADRFEFLGWVEDMPDYYDSLDVFVLPSSNEGIPGAVREAMATEVPTVATAVGGTPDVIDHGETGLLVEPEDADALAGAIERLLDDPGARDRLGRAGRERIVRRFSLEQYVQRYESLFAALGGGD